MHTLKHTLKYLFLIWGVFFLSPTIKAQNPDSLKIINGQAIDASNGKAIPGIKVEIPGYSSSFTNDSGYFSLKVPSLSATILVSGMEYHACEVPLKGQTNITVVLYEGSHTSLYDIAKFPTGNKTLSQTTNAVSSINISGDSWKQSPDNISQNLQGKIAGLNVISRSGAINIGSEMFLRGYSSLNTNNRPLIIVDGTIYDMNSYGNSIIENYYYDPLSHIDPRDIDNITISKDANSIYGSKAGNGIIYITTSHTKDAATKIDFNISGGLNFAPEQYPVLGTNDYRTYLSELLTTKGYSPSGIETLPYMNDKMSNSDYYIYHNNTNWQDQVLNNSTYQNYYLKITGGDENALYGLSIGYLNQNGIIKKTNNERISLRFNGDIEITNKLKLSTNLSLTNSTRLLKDQGLNEKVNPLFMSLIKSPFLYTNQLSSEGKASPTEADVDIFGIGNPTAVINNMEPKSKNLRFLGTINLTYDINSNFKLTSVFGLTFDKNREFSFKPHLGIVPDTLENALGIRTCQVYSQRLFALYNDTWLGYNKVLDNVHNISVIAGFRYLYNRTEADLDKAYNSATDDLRNLDDGDPALRKSSGSTDKCNWMNGYASVDYNYNNKYFVSANVGIDGSSRFGKDISDGLTINGNKFGVFPSVSAAWLISSEEFMTKAPFINLLKLRASYGLTGNDDIGNYTTRQLYTADYLYQLPGLVRQNIASPSLQWETNKKFDAGIDLSLLNERIWMTLDVYQNTTTNMLTRETPLFYSGVDYIVTNNGGMKSIGVEYTINGRILNGPVKWDLGFSIAYNKSEITKLPSDSLITSYAGGNYISIKGESPAAFYGYRTNGVYSTNAEASNSGLQNELSTGERTSFRGGDVRFVDINQDGVINDQDRCIIGRPAPYYIGSITTNVNWKRLTLNAYFTYSLGNDVYNYTRYRLESMSGYENQTKAVLKRWRTDGQYTTMPRAEWGDPQGNNRFSDRWIEDGSYIRLKCVTLSYDIPVRTNAIKYATLYASGYNLWTYTTYLGYDPEFCSSSSVLRQGVDVTMVPNYKTILIGFKLGL
jgi:TonB-linked SusC/RagA family outer membrane protein